MKLYKAHLESTCLQGSNYVVQLDLFYDDDEKTAKLFYSYLNNTLKCELKVALPQNTRGLRVHMQPTEYKSVAILCFKSMDDIKNIISTSSEVDAKKRFIAIK